MWGYDVSRRHVTETELPRSLHLHWIRQLPEPQRAWPWQMDDFEKLAFDVSYEPVAAGALVYVASMVTDSITAYDIDTGAEQWRYVTDGPVRMAPTLWHGRLYAVSDDGHLYCLHATEGTLIWKFRAAPSARTVLGNNRLISMWPGRGGPAVYDGIVYFAAGVWPSEGVFIYALDAVTGAVVWENSRSANEIYVDSKRYYSYGGVAPQGQLVVSGDHLLVPGGRTVPAAFNRHTGEFLYLRLAGSTTGKGAGGHRVFALGDWFFNVRDTQETHIYALMDGAQHSMTPVTIATNKALFGVPEGRERLCAYDAAFAPTDKRPPKPEDTGERQFIERGRIGADGRAPSLSNRMNSGALAQHYALNRRWVTHVQGLNRLHLVAGNALYGSGPDGRIFAMDITDVTREPNVIWTARVPGEVFGMIAAQDRLFVTTEDGALYCFGPEARETVTHPLAPETVASSEDDWGDRVGHLLENGPATAGYALLFGIGTGRLLEELLAQSDLHIIAFDPDPSTVARFRDRFIDAGLYGRQLAVHLGDVTTAHLPPYIAEIIASEDIDAAGLAPGADLARALFHPLRPYGGTIFLPLRGTEGEAFARGVKDAALEQALLTQAADHLLLTRPGPLPGAGSWTHQYADAGNSAYSADRIARAPMGITWFGATPNHKTLPRHMHGPIPQIVAGRLIILGVNHISARCVYTGRELWATELPLVGELFTSFEHEAQPAPVYFPNHPGANFIGSPYVSAEDSIYLIHEDRCLRLDTATGAILDTFDMPDWGTLQQQERDPFTDEMKKSYGAILHDGEQLRWGNIRFTSDWLIAAAYPHMFDDTQPGREESWNATSSEFIVLMNRHTGDIQWVHQARYGFRHNAIAAGDGKVFVIDNLSENFQGILRRRGIRPDTEPRIRALDIETGAVLWTYEESVFGTSLSYSEAHGVLVQSGHPGRRAALPDEPRDRLAGLRGEDGALLWADAFTQRRSPISMHATRRQVIASTQEPSVDMVSGEFQTRVHPITGKTEPWNWVGALRCGTQNYSEYLIAFRSGAAGLADLAYDAGTTQVAGFRPGCTNSLVVADGMLNAPDYTRSCSCSYQHQTSLGLTHMPEAEWWIFNTLSDPEPGTIRHVAINLGAPGSRFDPSSNTLWLEYPMVGGPAPTVPIELNANDPVELFRSHSALIAAENDSRHWVAASGVRDLETLRLGGLFDDGAATYTVRLHFSEPEELTAGQRIFNIYMQGERVAEGIDIVRDSGGPRQGLVRTFTNQQLAGALHLELKPAQDTGHPPVLSGVEILLEDWEPPHEHLNVTRSG